MIWPISLAVEDFPFVTADPYAEAFGWTGSEPPTPRNLWSGARVRAALLAGAAAVLTACSGTTTNEVTVDTPNGTKPVSVNIGESSEDCTVEIEGSEVRVTVEFVVNGAGADVRGSKTVLKLPRDGSVSGKVGDESLSANRRADGVVGVGIGAAVVRGWCGDGPKLPEVPDLPRFELPDVNLPFGVASRAFSLQ